MRYSILHPFGIKPPSNTLDVDRWSDLEPATPNGTKFLVEKKDGTTDTIHVTHHTEQLLLTLIVRPVRSSSRCRLSEYKAALLDLGVEIECEGFRGDERGRRTFGIYFLRSRVTPIPPAQEAA